MDIFLSDERILRLTGAIYQLFMGNRISEKNKKEFYKSTIDPGKYFLVELFKDGVKKGIFKKSLLEDGAYLAVTIMASLDGMGMYYQINRDIDELKKQTEVYIKYVLESIKK